MALFSLVEVRLQQLFRSCQIDYIVRRGRYTSLVYGWIQGSNQARAWPNSERTILLPDLGYAEGRQPEYLSIWNGQWIPGNLVV